LYAQKTLKIWPPVFQASKTWIPANDENAAHENMLAFTPISAPLANACVVGDVDRGRL
jgi:hypothetical protein